jgi:hypothetical protein
MVAVFGCSCLWINQMARKIPGLPEPEVELLAVTSGAGPTWRSGPRRRGGRLQEVGDTAPIATKVRPDSEPA